MHAVVLAGGKGTRLAPYTTTLPKPLVPVGEQPILGILLKQLAASGVTDVVLAVNHMAQLIQAYFGNGQAWFLNINYSLEDKPLSTVAPLKLINGLPETFLVLNGDILTDLDFEKLYVEHLASDALVTVATFERSSVIDYGVLETDTSGAVVEFLEKPIKKHLVSMGIYVFNRAVLDFVPDNTAYGFDDLMYCLLAKGIEIRTHRHDGYWLDIGRPEDFDKANREYENLLAP
jgi:NDP-mannose synthase